MFRWMMSLLTIVGSLGHGHWAMAESIRVSAAVSLRESLGEIAQAYQAESGDEVLLVFGGSGQLATQIKNGADVDVFISAATKPMDDLAKENLLAIASRAIVARNRLVLIVPAPAAQPPDSFEALADGKYSRVAIGDPRTVPAGDYAMQVLTSLKLAEKLAARLVYGANVRQVLAYVQRNEVAAGLVYATDARQAGDRVKIVATADAATHQPIVYPAACLSRSGHSGSAARFVEYLGSDAAKRILVSKGFVVDEAPKP